MEKYNEILKLKKMLDKECIKNKQTKVLDGYSISVYFNNNVITIEEHNASDGHEEDKLEMLYGLTYEELKKSKSLGFLSAEEAFKRIKYCFNNNTIYYSPDSTFNVTIECTKIYNNCKIEIIKHPLGFKCALIYSQYQPPVDGVYEQYFINHLAVNVEKMYISNKETDKLILRCTNYIDQKYKVVS